MSVSLPAGSREDRLRGLSRWVEVLREALELLAWYDAEVEAKRDALRGIIREGIESGAPRDTDIDALVAELNAKFDRP